MSIEKNKRDIKEILKDLNNIGTRANDTFSSIAGEIGKVSQKLQAAGGDSEDLAKSFKNQEKTVKDLKSSSDILQKQIKDGLKDRNATKKALEESAKIQSKIAAIESQIRINNFKLQRAQLDGNQEVIEAIQKENALLGEAAITAQELVDGFGEIADKAEEINKSSKAFDRIGDALDTIPGIGPLISEPFKNAADAARDSAVEGDNLLESIQKVGMELITTKGILALIATTLFSADKRTTSLATNLQISKEEAREINKDFADISVNSGKAFMNSANLVEATIELSKNFGVANKLSSDLVKSQTFLTKQLGLSAEEASEIQKLNAETGKSAEQTEKEIADQVASLQKETGIALKLDDVFADVANTNEQLKASFGFNTREIAKSVVKAKQLGLTIEQSARAAESLLDFEQSIQNELQAELLTGKNLNLEQARLLALQGKSTDAAAELVKQVGSVEEFTNMNVIQQRNLAAAVGMEANELIKTVRQKELLAELGAKDLAQAAQTEEGRQKILDLGGEQLLQQVQQESAAAKFESAVIKIQEAIGTMVEGPLGKFIDGFASVVSSAGALKAIMVGIGALSLGRVIASLASMAAANAANATAALTFASAISFGIGIVAILGAVVAGLATMNSEADKAASKLKKKDDVMIGPDGGTIVSGPEGSIQLNQKDSIIAGTDLFGGDNTASTTAPVNISTKSLEGKIDQLIAINQQILAKSPVIEMSGNRVGQGINVAERAIQ